MDKSYVITQSNNLIEARHINPLTAREQKIILTMVSMIQPTDEDFKDYNISVKEFSNMLGLEGGTKYSELKEITKHLMSKSIEIPRKDGGWLFANWISSAEYQKGKGIISLSFSPKLMPYLLQLKTAFTSYKLSNILSLKSSYSIRLYELMKKWQYLGKWECSVEALREKIGATNKSYTLYGNFKNKILLAALRELNEQTDLLVNYIEIKKGRKVESIRFIIKHAPEREITLPPKKSVLHKKETKNEDVRERLNALTNNYNFDQTYFSMLYQGAQTIWKDQAERELTFLICYVNEESTIKNPLGFIKSKLQIAWEVYESGIPITFADLKPNKRLIRDEKVPEWFWNKDISNEKTENPTIEEERKKLIAELRNL